MESFDESIVLLQWRPTWAIQAFLRFESIPYELENSAYPTNSFGVLPQLRDGNFVLSGEENVMIYLLNYLNKKNMKNENKNENENESANEVNNSVPSDLLKLLFEDLPNILSRSEALDHPDVRQQLFTSYVAAVKASPSWLLGLTWAGSMDQRRTSSTTQIIGKQDEQEVTKDANELYGKLLTYLLNDQNKLEPHVMSLVKACLYGHVAEALLLPCLNHALLLQGMLIESFLTTYESCFVAKREGGGSGPLDKDRVDKVNGCNSLSNLPTALSVARWGVRLEEDTLIKYNGMSSNGSPSWLSILLVALPVFSLSFMLHHHHHK